MKHQLAERSNTEQVTEYVQITEYLGNGGGTNKKNTVKYYKCKL